MLLLTSVPVTENVSSAALGSIAGDFSLKPRAVSGEVAARAAEALGVDGVANAARQCAAVTVVFLPPAKGHLSSLDEAAVLAGVSGSGGSAGSAKRPKTGPGKGEVQSVRLRHLLVRHRDIRQPFDPVRKKPVIRTQLEADARLRGVLRELLLEQRTLKAEVRQDRKASMAHVQPTPKCLTLTKEFSECESATKGGGMCGDLGWVSFDDLRSFGPTFAEVARTLSVGQWSDLVSSDHGVHLLQRIA